MPTTYTLINSNVLSTTAASVTFSSIPATYTDLVLKVSARDDAAANYQQFLIRINGDATSLYSSTWIQADNSTATSSFNTPSYIAATPVVSANATANTFNSAEIYFPNYTTSQNRPVSSFGVSERNATDARMNAIAGLYRSTTIISSLTALCAGAASFVSGSSFYLYGIKNS